MLYFIVHNSLNKLPLFTMYPVPPPSKSRISFRFISLFISIFFLSTKTCKILQLCNVGTTGYFLIRAFFAYLQPLTIRKKFFPPPLFLFPFLQPTYFISISFTQGHIAFPVRLLTAFTFQIPNIKPLLSRLH